MKILKVMVFAILGVVFAINISNGQDYKHPFGLVKEDGKVLSPEGKFLGSITKEGIIKDSTGTKIAQVDGQGNLVDAISGKKLGKAQKNGNYVPYGSKTPDESWSVSPPLNGNCEVKNKKGEVIVVVHENYKQYGACAYHCLSMKKSGKDMKMK